jgi:hypothetical protein
MGTAVDDAEPVIVAESAPQEAPETPEAADSPEEEGEVPLAVAESETRESSVPADELAEVVVLAGDVPPDVHPHASTLPQILVTIRSLLPKGQIEPHALVQSPAPWIGGYQLILIGFGIVWLGGLFAILFVGRKKHAASALAMRGPLTLSDRLRPMVEDAIAGRLSIGKQAELERLLLAFWRRRLGLENMKPGQALAVLREHDEAGLLLRQLERWLHAPKQAPNADVDATIKALLEPYARDSAVDWVSEPTSSGVGWVSDPTFSERKEPRSESQATSRTGDPTYGEGH